MARADCIRICLSSNTLRQTAALRRHELWVLLEYHSENVLGVDPALETHELLVEEGLGVIILLVFISPKLLRNPAHGHGLIEILEVKGHVVGVGVGERALNKTFQILKVQGGQRDSVGVIGWQQNLRVVLRVKLGQLLVGVVLALVLVPLWLSHGHTRIALIWQLTILPLGSDLIGLVHVHSLGWHRL